MDNGFVRSLDVKDRIYRDKREIFAILHVRGMKVCMFLSYHVRLAKWLSVRLRTKWLWVRVQLQSLKYQGLF